MILRILKRFEDAEKPLKVGSKELDFINDERCKFYLRMLYKQGYICTYNNYSYGITVLGIDYLKELKKEKRPIGFIN